MSSCFLPPNSHLPTPTSQLSPPNSHLPTPTSQPSSTPILCVATRKSQRDKIEYSHTLTFSHSHTLTPSHPQSSLAQLGIPLTDVLKVLVAGLLLGNILFYEAKNQELSMQGSEGIPIPPSPLHTPHTILPHPLCSSFIPPSLHPSLPELRAVGNLLGVQPQLLQRALTLRTYRSGRGQVVYSACSAAAVSATCCETSGSGI